jgi:hypothetical protein
MRRDVSSRIMPRTTLDLDPSVLAELKRRGRRDGKSLGRLVSELLAEGLHREAAPARDPFTWKSSRMNARVDLDDVEAVRRSMAE